MNGLDHEESSEIDFVATCLICGVINKEELHDWAEHIMVTRENYPLYIVDLYEFNEIPAHIYNAIGFGPSTDYSSAEQETFDQLAFDRHGIVNDNCSKSTLSAKEYYSRDLVGRFKSIFAFLSDAGKIDLRRSP